jgi:GTP cyclohydrolase I
MKYKEGNLPDVATESRSKIESKVNRVGMTEIELPIMLEHKKKSYMVPATASAFVSLDQTHVKGIHMSRLFSKLQELAESPLSTELLEKIVRNFQESHAESSNDSELRLKFQLMHHKASLISNMVGWRHYPVECVIIHENKKIEWHLKYSVVYSSTCPCSAALARQLIQQKFKGDFAAREKVDTGEISLWLAKEDSACATPHSQRSFANISVKLKKPPENIVNVFEQFIQQTEECLKTPVQTFVKRADEQEFARLNAENLMFCEDAARRLQGLLAVNPLVNTFCVEVEHQESLHPHNAVAKAWSTDKQEPI